MNAPGGGTGRGVGPLHFPHATSHPADAARLAQHRSAYDRLSEDPVLSAIAASFGPADPFDWGGRARTGEDRFRTLTFLVIGHAAAHELTTAQFDALTVRAGAPLTAQGLVVLGRDGIEAAGLAPDKADAVIALSRAVAECRVDLEAMDDLDDQQISRLLTAIPGIRRRPERPRPKWRPPFLPHLCHT